MHAALGTKAREGSGIQSSRNQRDHLRANSFGLHLHITGPAFAVEPLHDREQLCRLQSEAPLSAAVHQHLPVAGVGCIGPTGAGTAEVALHLLPSTTVLCAVKRRT